jgi:hypothetical protein
MNEQIQNLIPIQYQGYYWDPVEKELYSLKGKNLRKLKQSKASDFNNWNSNYLVLDNGQKRVIYTAALEKQYKVKS